MLQLWPSLFLDATGGLLSLLEFTEVNDFLLFTAFWQGLCVRSSGTQYHHDEVSDLLKAFWTYTYVVTAVVYCDRENLNRLLRAVHDFIYSGLFFSCKPCARDVSCNKEDYQGDAEPDEGCSSAVETPSSL